MFLIQELLRLVALDEVINLMKQNSITLYFCCSHRYVKKLLKVAARAFNYSSKYLKTKKGFCYIYCATVSDFNSFLFVAFRSNPKRRDATL